MRSSIRRAGTVAVAVTVMVAGVVILAASPASAVVPATPLVISEFRLRGPSGANDEFVEIANIGASNLTVAASTGTGFGIAASDGVVRCTIANGVIIPAGGHFLCTNSVAYSLAGYPSGAGDATFTTDIADNAGVALFTTNVPGDFAVGTRLDAVGSTSEANTLYKEGTGYPTLTPFSIDYSFYRTLTMSAIPSLQITNPTPGVPQDTDDNSADFTFVDTNGTSAGAGQRLGAPGPESLSSPLPGSGIGVSLLDPCAGAFDAPNAVRDFTSVPAQNSTFGTISFARTLTNNTGTALTSLRLRVADQRTFPAPSGWADMRTRTSTTSLINVDRAPCGTGNSDVSVAGTTLQQPPSQPNGGGFNTSLGVDAVTALTPLAIGASIDIQVLTGIQQTGKDALRFVVEAFPTAGGGTPTVTCLGATTVSNEVAQACVNNPPVAVADSYSTNEDTTLTVGAGLGVLNNDTDAETDPLTAVLDTDVAHGTLTLAADGSFGYVPDADYNGPDSFTYHANDGTADGNTVTVALTVDAVNDGPVALADAYSTPEDTTLTVVAGTGVLVNDSDTDLDSLTAVLDTDVAHGTLTLAADGGFGYVPDADYSGPDSFTYHDNDGTADGNTVTVTLTVGASADAPVAAADSYSVGEDIVLSPDAGAGVLANDSDGDGDTLHASIATGATHGSVALSDDGSFTYTPTLDFTGPDSFTYTASDGDTSTAETTVDITVTPTPGTSAERFVTDAYQVILHRSPDSGGLTFWATKVTAGFPRDAVARSLIHSDEGSNVLIRQAYDQILDRSADAGGLSFWRSFLAGGGTFQEVEARLTGSAEFFANAGGTNADFVHDAYNVLLSRNADTPGLNSWVQRLDGGESRLQVARSLLASGEGRHVQLAPFFRRALLRSPVDSEETGFRTILVHGDWRVAAAFIIGSAEFLTVAEGAS